MNRNLFAKYILLNQSLYTLSEKAKSKIEDYVKMLLIFKTVVGLPVCL